MILNKHYYSIGEVAEMFNVSASLLRYWEKEFTKLKPQKSKRGIRQFTKKDIEVVKSIYDLVKIKGFTLDGAKKRLKNEGKKKKSEIDLERKTLVINKLRDIKSSLNNLKKEL